VVHVTGQPGVAVPAAVPDERPRPRRRRPAIWRWVVFAVLGTYFLVPLIASFWFTIEDRREGGFTAEYYTGILGADGFTSAFGLSVQLAVLTIVITLGLMIPTVLVVYLRLPQLRAAVELITLLPLVRPPIVLVIGVGTVLRWGPNELAGTPLGDFLVGLQDERLPWILVFVYVVLAMPFAYRSLDAGIRAVDLHTLVEAARSLGASWPAVVGRVVVPVLRTAVLNAAFLTLALVLGEYTIARLLLFKPFPVWVVEISGAEAQLSVSVSILSLGLAWFLLIAVSSLGGRRGRDTTLRSL